QPCNGTRWERLTTQLSLPQPNIKRATPGRAPGSPFAASPLGADQLDQRLDVAEREGERLRLPRVALDLRRVVGHDHAVVTDLLVDAHAADHVHVAVVGERLAEVEEAALDVAEVDVEDLPAAAEPADDLVDLLARLLEHLGHRPLAEVQAVILARRGLD